MKRANIFLLFLINIVFFSCNKTQEVTTKDYQRAEKALTRNIKKLVHNLNVYPHWINNTSDYWYIHEHKNKKRFILVCDNRKHLAFRHNVLAEKLSEILNTKIDSNYLPFKYIKFIDKTYHKFSFNVRTRRFIYDNKSEELTEEKSENSEGGNISPDSKYKAIVIDNNLYIKNLKTGKFKQLTRDGSRWYNYAQALPSPKEMVKQNREDIEQWTDVFWTPDSRKIITYIMDQRKSGKQWLIQSEPIDSRHPKLYTFTYSLPEDKEMAKAYPVIFDIKTGKMTKIKTEPIEMLDISSPWMDVCHKSNKFFYFLQVERGYKKVNLVEVNLKNGNTRTIFTETNNTCVDPYSWMMYITDNCEEVIWASERDDWNQLYLYDVKKAKLKNKITDGKWVVRSIKKVDEKNKIIYLMASGVDKDCNPYYTKLYSVNFNGSDFKCLTPENTYHYTYISPDFKGFIDIQSTLDQEPEYSFRGLETGKTLHCLLKTDAEELRATGWISPEEFIAKAGDGKTDIYCTIYKPSNFDPNKKYPVIDKVYTGPHNFFAGRNFWAFYSEAQSFAELGFIVVEIDGRGTNKRGKKYHNYSYKNLGGGCDDHVSAIKQMAKKLKYIDINKVGIYGFSAGGYDTAHAMFKFPDFYKVGISASGNHDHRTDKTCWNEIWMGYPVKSHYEEQSNINWAHKLQGKLLLVHGELDDNVNPIATMQLVNALIKANKDFDFLIIPNQFHYLYKSPYYVRKRWDYFVKNLMGKIPPKEYKINSINLQ